MQGYNRYPDEKGTESIIHATLLSFVREVTTVTPMKRGLKGLILRDADDSVLCYNRYPDEKGTERFAYAATANTIGFSYNRYPDEKGTESEL